MLRLFCTLCMFLMPCLFSDQPSPVEIPPMSEEAARFYYSGNWLWIVQQIFPMIVFAVLLFSGFSVTMRKWATKWSSRRWAQILMYFFMFWVVLFVVSLPLSYYVEFVRPHAYGLSSQSFGKWMGDALLSTGISLVVGGLITLVIYTLIKKSPKRWWIYSTLLTLPFIIFAILVTPLWVEPLFNKFGPMKDKKLEAQILHLANCAGIEGSKVYEVDKSEDTHMLNAYVTGFGHTKRIVLWDTIIAKLTPRELLFVMGHEMGHFVLHHIEKDIIFQFAMSFLLFLFLSYGTFLVKKHKKRLRLHSLSDIASLPLLLLMASIFFFLIAPLSLVFSRHLEHEADGFGLEITRDNRAAASAFVKLQQENLANPYPGSWFVFWRASHPPLGKRIEYCNTYAPWKEGEQLKFQEYIKEECVQSSH